LSDPIYYIYKKEAGINGEAPIGRLLGLSPSKHGTDLLVLLENGELKHVRSNTVLVKVVDKNMDELADKIAKKVLSQLSEKVIQEIAWEVVPDLAEAIIQKEIAEIKAKIPQ